MRPIRWGRPDASAIFAVGTSGALRSLDAGKTFGALAPTPAVVNLMNEVWGLADGEIVVLAARQHALDEGRVLRSVGLAGSASATPSWTRAWPRERAR